MLHEKPKDELLLKIEQRMEALERQVEKINTLEIYLKRIIKVEERIGVLRGKVNKEDIQKKEKIKNIESHIVTEAKQLIDKEIKPIQHMLIELFNKISQLENQVVMLEKKTTEDINKIKGLLEKKNQQEGEREINLQNGQPIIFQEIHIDKLFMDKYEQTNNLGQLGIKELSGHLTIGASYDKGVIPNELVEEWKKEMSSLQQMKENEQKKETDDDE